MNTIRLWWFTALEFLKLLYNFLLRDFSLYKGHTLIFFAKCLWHRNFYTTLNSRHDARALLNSSASLLHSFPDPLYIDLWGSLRHFGAWTSLIFIFINRWDLALSWYSLAAPLKGVSAHCCSHCRHVLFDLFIKLNTTPLYHICHRRVKSFLAQTDTVPGKMLRWGAGPTGALSSNATARDFLSGWVLNTTWRGRTCVPTHSLALSPGNSPLLFYLW